MSKDGRTAIRNEIALSWDGHDKQGSALSNGFAVCDVLTYVGGEVPAECGYRPSPLGVDGNDYPESMFCELYEDGTIDDDDLAYWARVLVRYTAMIPEDERY